MPIPTPPLTHSGFRFLDPGVLADGELTLEVAEYYPGDPTIRYVPAYFFHMVHTATREKMGHLHLRVGHNDQIYYCGHIGYGVKLKYRGNRFAERATRLVFPLARAHGINPLWITCNPDNAPSRHTILNLGGRLVDIVPVPQESEMYLLGDREKCRFWFELA
jgi:predicted acetyltransferase